MTLTFNSQLFPLPPSASLFGCVQTSQLPSKSLSIDSQFYKCPNCGTPLFPYKGLKKVGCPICDQSAQFELETYYSPAHSMPLRPFFFVFDISIDISTVSQLLTQFADNLTDEDRFSIICISDRLIFLTVDSGLLVLKVFSSYEEVNLSNSALLSKAELKSTILPSISTISALIPAEIPEAANIYEAINAVKRIMKRISFVMLAFISRPPPELSVDDAEDLGESLSACGSVLMIGATSEFRRLTAIARYSFGPVFAVSSIYSDLISRAFVSMPLARSIKIIAPRFIEFAKVTGGEGKLIKTPIISKLKLSSFVGGSISFTVDPQREHTTEFYIVEKIKSQSGDFISLHKFSFATTEEQWIASEQADVTRTLILKGFASTVLRRIWNGDELNDALSTTMNARLSQMLKGSSIESNAKDIQQTVVRLYSLLIRHGIANIEVKMSASEKEIVLSSFPAVFLYSKSGTAEKCPIDDSWPVEMRVISNSNAFKLLLDRYGIQSPPLLNA